MIADLGITLSEPLINRVRKNRGKLGMLYNNKNSYIILVNGYRIVNDGS